VSASLNTTRLYRTSRRTQVTGRVNFYAYILAETEFLEVVRANLLLPAAGPPIHGRSLRSMPLLSMMRLAISSIEHSVVSMYGTA